MPRNVRGRPSVCSVVPTSAIGVGLQSLRTHPLRALLSTLGVVIGSASLSAMLSLGDATQGDARARLDREGLTRVSLEAVTHDVVDGHRVLRAAYPLFTTRDAEAVADAVPDAAVTLEVSGTALADLDGTRRAVAVRGVWATGREASAGPLEAGRWPTRRELDAGLDVAVVCDRTARTLTGHAATGALGHVVVLGGRPFRIVGVEAGPPDGRSLSATVALGPGEAAMAPSISPRTRTVHVDVPRAEDTSGARLRLERAVQQRPAWQGSTRVVSPGPEHLREVGQVLQIVQWLLGAFAPMALLVGGIAIMNGLLASVAERTREVGIRKAVGARRRDIVAQFLVESVAIAGAGALLGVGVGPLTANAVTAMVRTRTEASLHASVTPGSLLAGAGAALLVGLVSGLYPALRASRLSPVDAIVRK